MMKRNTRNIMGLIAATLLVGCGGGAGGENTTNNNSNGTPPTTNTQCKDIAPTLENINKKYALSKDDYEKYDSRYTTYRGSKGSDDSGSDDKGSDDSGGGHNEGKACLSCHSFKSAGTIFTTLNAPDNSPGAAGYRIQLNDNIVYSNSEYGVGNAIAGSYPNGNYTAHVIDSNGNIVNSSAQNSHDVSRRNCNSCHNATGNNGAPGRITSSKLSTTTPTVTTTSSCVSFNSNVMPILEAKCKSCHGSNGNFEVTTANATHANISALKGSATASGTYLIGKGSNTIVHVGGNVISTSSAEYTTIKAWVTEGELNN